MSENIDRTGAAREAGAAGLIALVVVIAALYAASSVFGPVAFAIFIILLVWPLQKWLQAVLPKVVALAVSMMFILAVFAALLYLVAWAFGRVAQALLADAGRFQLLYEQAAAWLEGHGIAVAGIWTEHFNVGWLLRAIHGMTGRLNTTLSFWVVVLVYILLGLLEADEAVARVRRLDSEKAAAVLLNGSTVTGAKLRRYMLVRTLMSVLTGGLVTGATALIGLPFAPEWGVIAFALNYVPFLGPLVAISLPTLLALAHFGSWQVAAVTFACLNLVQFVVGSYVEPRVSGNALAISPFIVLFSVFAWAFLWGILGAFIGVPVTIAILSFCEQHSSSRWVADLLGASPGADMRPRP